MQRLKEPRRDRVGQSLPKGLKIGENMGFSGQKFNQVKITIILIIFAVLMKDLLFLSKVAVNRKRK